MFEEHDGSARWEACWKESTLGNCRWIVLGRDAVRWRERKDSTGWSGDASERREERSWAGALLEGGGKG